jgi:hypothetical protein
MEEDIKLLEKLEFIGYGKKEDIEALGRDEHVDTTTIIKNLINKYKEQEKAIQSLTESGRETLAMINLMTKFINKTGIHRRAYNCVFRNGECDECSCEHCIREFFKKKAKGE